MAGFKKASFNNLTPEMQDKLSSLVEGGFLKKDLERQQKNFSETPLDPDFFNSLMKPVSQESELVQPQPKEMNPIVKDYISKKLAEKNSAQREPAVTNPMEAATAAQPEQKQASFMDKYSDEERQKALDASYEGNGAMAFAQFLGGLGDTVAGKNPNESAQAFANYRAQQKDNNLGEFDRSKKAAIEDYSTKRTLEQNQITDAQRARDMDVNSEESKMARQLAIKMGMNPEVAKNLTAAKFKETSPVLEKMYAVDQARLARQDAAATRNESKAQREYEKNQKLETTYGTARTEDDAKQLKAAAETKAKFDAQLQELIALRKDKGVEYLDRESVARAKQLSRDLLLGYKDLAKLGVLSQSDEAILNDIIPNDPLGQDWAPGQDPTLHKLQKFQGDVQRDFDSRLDQRLRDPQNSKRQKQSNDTDLRIDSFMKKNGITDRAEAIKILKENGKL